MKTIITSTGNTDQSAFDARFGRAEYYCIYDDTEKRHEFIRNEFSMDKRSSGKNAAIWASRNRVKRIISGDFGPRAKDILDQAGIQMVILPDRDLTIHDIIAKISK